MRLASLASLASLSSLKSLWSPLLLLLPLLAGCTAGEIVDENFKASPIPTWLEFVAVNANGVPTGASYIFGAPANGSTAYISFDPNAPASANNVSEQVPPGDYYVTIPVPTEAGWMAIASPIFHHDFYLNETDYLTGQKNMPTAGYYFQIHLSCTTWQCVNGNSNPNPPSTTYQGVRVIPMIAILAEGDPTPGSPAAPGSLLQNGW